MGLGLWKVTLLGLVVGVLGTGLGGCLVALLGELKQRSLSFVLGFSGGIMLAIIFVDLLDEAVEIGGVVYTFVGLSLGVGLLVLLDMMLPHIHAVQGGEQSNHFMRMSILLGLGIAMHNLPEGMAVGAGFAVSDLTGWWLGFTMFVQNIPEGMAMAGPMAAAGLSPMKMIGYTAAAGIPMGIGAWLGALIGNVSPVSLTISLGFAAGAMLYIVFDELVPEAQRQAKGHSGTFGAVAGVLLGVAISMFTN
ncbi:MAG: ZIP family metal transporter [Firmicutes bacterium]|nr:ZIP family metal transporter [Bacillota bacterium]